LKKFVVFQDMDSSPSERLGRAGRKRGANLYGKSKNINH